MAYSTVAKIRQEAGFQNNSNVTDATITTQQDYAFGIVRQYVARRYALSTLSGALFTGSPAEDVLELCERLLAAGGLQDEQYQGQPIGEAEGKAKKDRAMEMLEAISSGKMVLIDVNGDIITSEGATSGGLSAAYTAPPRTDAEPSSSERKFTVDKKW